MVGDGRTLVAPLRIVFLGTPGFAVPTLERLLESWHRVVGVLTQPDRPRGRGRIVSDSPVKAVAVHGDLPVLQPASLRDATVDAWLSDLRPDLGVVAAYGKLLPERLLTIPRLGVVNVHASLLPRYRGAAPVHRAVMAGERETGVTIMRVVRELDAGAMFAKCSRAIGADETSDSVERALAGIGAELLVSVVDQLAAGTAREEPQDDSQATYARRLTKDEGLIDWSRAAQAIHDQVRGLYPWPHAWTFVGGLRALVLRTGIGDPVADLAAGTVTGVGHDGVHVAAGDGRTLTIKKLQLEGGRPMGAGDFLAGHPLSPGATLGQR